MPRKARLDAPGTLHHAVIRGIERGRIVEDDQDRKNFVSRLGNLAQETKTLIYAWSLMTNHAHMLLRSGPSGLPKFMRRLLTGHSVTYNLRHHRSGHLFQNRYRSVVCDEDAYFRELVRYIHLNPLRAGLVRTLSELDSYPWSGHAVLMGRVKHEWQGREYVLSWFGKGVGEGRRAYREYMGEGVAQGRRPDLVGGGLVRSYGGWSAVLSLRGKGEEAETTDARVLGKGDFVDRVLREGARWSLHPMKQKEWRRRIRKIIEHRCLEKGMDVEEVRMGSRRGQIPEVRAEIAEELAKKLGVPLAEIARAVGISTSGVSKILGRRQNNST
jgi:putative transposase